MHSPPPYRAVRLALIGTPEFYFPEALSEAGVVGGYMRRSSFEPPYDLPVTWDAGGHPTQLPVVGLHASGLVRGFRRDGVPVGSLNRPGQGYLQPGYWGPSDFLLLPQDGLGGQAISGTDSFVFGQTFYPTATPGQISISATIWDAGGTHVVGGLAAVDSFAWAVNGDGVFVGVTIDRSDPTDYDYGGFIGRGTAATRLAFPGFTEVQAYAINDDGWFTGVWEPAFATQRGYLARWDLDTGGREIYDLGIFPGYGETVAYAINNDRTVVGGAQQLGGDFDRALIWWRGSLTPQDLNLFVDIPGATLIDAYRINNAGQILAEARLHAGGYAYYVLTPVPEPAGLCLHAAIVASLVRRPRRRVA